MIYDILYMPVCHSENLDFFCVSSLCMETSLGTAPVWEHPFSRCDSEGFFIFCVSSLCMETL